MLTHFYLYLSLTLLFICIFTLEVITPASKNKCDKRWLFLALSLNGITTILSVTFGYFLPDVIQKYALFHTQGSLNDVTTALIAFFIASFVFYWWHRATHYFNFLWRFFHQLHHSARRLESLTSFFAHPFDVTATILLNAFCCYFILGASPFASFLELLLAGFFSLWTHMDLKTPYWLGYIIQRPEMHSIHHQKNHHSDNYAGFPLWDMLFGTWKNPHKRCYEFGFDDDKSERIFDMLRCKDVHKN